MAEVWNLLDMGATTFREIDLSLRIVSKKKKILSLRKMLHTIYEIHSDTSYLLRKICHCMQYN